MSAESTQVTLDIDGTSYEGSTGVDCGHAEMHALDCYIDSRHEGDVDAAAARLKQSRRKVVNCSEKPVCIKCAEVLQKLGFTTGAGTEFGKKTMGGTEWGCTNNVRQLLAKCGIDYESVKQLTSQ